MCSYKISFYLSYGSLTTCLVFFSMKGDIKLSVT